MNADFKKLLELNHEYQTLEINWYRHLLTLSAGALALMASLGLTVSSTPSLLSRYLLVLVWVGLGIGLVSGSATTYLVVNRARKHARVFREELLSSLTDHRTMKIEPVKPDAIFSLYKKVMVGSLLLTVLCLVSYMVLTTLAV